MLSKEARKERNSLFWSSFRKEMRSVKSAGGKAINWINYPSEVKDVYIRLEADGKGARFCFDIQPKDEGIRSILWEQMTELKKVMENETGPASYWNEDDHYINGRKVSRICWEEKALSFYRDADLEEIKTFLKKKLIDFDRFYQEYKDILIALAE